MWESVPLTTTQIFEVPLIPTPKQPGLCLCKPPHCKPITTLADHMVAVSAVAMNVIMVTLTYCVTMPEARVLEL